MAVAAILISTGASPSEALATIAKERGVEVPETPEQRKWIEGFALSLAS